MTSESVIKIIQSRFDEVGENTEIPIANTYETFNAAMRDEGIYVDNLGALHFLPWVVFTETVRLLEIRGGRALLGDADFGRLGDDFLPLDSVEGYLAVGLYDKMVGDEVFPRIIPVASILEWASIARIDGDYLNLLL